MKAELPINEVKRLEALHSYRILDTMPEACYDDIVLLASEICAVPIAAVSLVDEKRQWFKSKIGLDISQTPREVAFCAHAILEPDLLVVPDAKKDPRFADNPLVTGEPGIRFYAGTPLLTRGSEALGSLCVMDNIPRICTEAQANSLRALSRQVMAQFELRKHIYLQEQQRQVLETYQRKLEETNARLRVESLTDDVTGFHNTRFLHQFLDQHLIPDVIGEGKMSLVFFDLDDFKKVVDANGHLLATKILREVALTVHQNLDAEDRIVRYGGDEYVVILPGQSQEQAWSKTEHIRRAISSNLFLQTENICVKVTASFGLAVFPDDAKDKKQLLLAADNCLFRSKRSGKNRISSASES